MVNKGRIHRELGNFEIYLWNSIKSENELRLEIKNNSIEIKKDNSISNLRNQKSSDLDYNLWSNQSLKMRENIDREIDWKPKLNWN